MEKNGNPHNRESIVTDDWVTKCDQKPSWVPGRARLSRSRFIADAQYGSCSAAAADSAEFDTIITTSTPATSESDAALK